MADALLRGLGLDGLSLDPAAAADRFGDPNAPTSIRTRVRVLVRERGRVMTDAWLSEAGHTRPGMKAGLPMKEAADRTAEIDRKIDAVAKP
jgi:hypothetical protein